MEMTILGLIESCISWVRNYPNGRIMQIKEILLHIGTNCSLMLRVRIIESINCESTIQVTNHDSKSYGFTLVVCSNCVDQSLH